MTNWSSMAKGSGRDWYLAASLIALGNEVNAKWPNRDTASDGAIGDASHQARKSDHNPDYSAGGVVRAIDVDNGGINVQSLLDATIGDDRVWYVIWDRHIYSRTYGWKKRPYDGSDPHTGHVHISLNHTKAAESATPRWFGGTTTTPPSQEDELMGAREDILAYQKACTIQIQDNTRQNLNNAVNTILDGVQKYAVAVNNFTRQTDAGSDKERDAALNKLRTDLMTSLTALQDAAPAVPEPPQ